MRLDAATPDTRVSYQAHANARVEYGTVAGKNKTYVFVLFDGDMTPKSVYPEMLERAR